MGTVTIRCPKTGKCISTGMEASRAAFGLMPVFFGRTFCPSCRISHEWFARNAWVCDFGLRTVTRIVRGGSYIDNIVYSNRLR
jgi:hypothetical protein